MTQSPSKSLRRTRPDFRIEFQQRCENDRLFIAKSHDWAMMAVRMLVLVSAGAATAALTFLTQAKVDELQRGTLNEAAATAFYFLGGSIGAGLIAAILGSLHAAKHCIAEQYLATMGFAQEKIDSDRLQLLRGSAENMRVAMILAFVGALFLNVLALRQTIEFIKRAAPLRVEIPFWDHNVLREKKGDLIPPHEQNDYEYVDPKTEIPKIFPRPPGTSPNREK